MPSAVSMPAEVTSTETITFLMTDVEGSTRMWERWPDAMRAALARHEAIVEVAVTAASGTLLKKRGEGDAMFCVFSDAPGAVAAALEMQRAFADESWPEPLDLRVRIALHSGDAELRDDDYYGPAVNRCARLRAIAHGAQTIVSGTTADLVVASLPEGASLRDLGQHRLRDLTRPERIYELVHPDLPGGHPPLRSLDAVRHNLPTHLSSFVGRDEELTAISASMEHARLVTVAGPGGVGKTRLVTQIAADLIDRFADGVWLVELAPLMDPTHVAELVASTLSLREQPDAPIETVIVDHLGPQSALLVLDNAEHVIDATARLVDTILRACPNVTVLATSREPLAVDGEHIHRLAPLPIDADGAVRLFVDRARAVNPSVRLDADTQPHIEAICARLDGIPLAIELAAGRAATLSVADIAERLTHRFSLLKGGARTAADRHRTLRATVDWSYELLSDEERAVFARLSVFRGGFELGAAEAVASSEGVEPHEVLDLLDGLVARSLIVADDGEPRRYGMLETIREYGLSMLPEPDIWHARHLAYMLAFGEQAAQGLNGPEQGAWIARLEPNHDNLRAALRWALDNGHPRDALLLTARICARFWVTLGYLREAATWLAEILAANPEPTPERATVLQAEGTVAINRVGLEQAERSFTAALELSRSLGLRGIEARALGSLGNIARQSNDPEAAMERYRGALEVAESIGERMVMALCMGNISNLLADAGDDAAALPMIHGCIEIFEEVGDHRGLATSLGNLSLNLLRRGENAPAREAAERSREISEKISFRQGAAFAITNLAAIAVAEGRAADAITLLKEGVTIYDTVGYQSQVAHCFEGFAEATKTLGDPELAARFFGHAQALRIEAGVPGTQPTLVEVAAQEASLRSLLGNERYEDLTAQGRALARSEAFALAMTL